MVFNFNVEESGSGLYGIMNSSFVLINRIITRNVGENSQLWDIETKKQES
jgi:hypothetical protein